MRLKTTGIAERDEVMPNSLILGLLLKRLDFSVERQRTPHGHSLNYILYIVLLNVVLRTMEGKACSDRWLSARRGYWPLHEMRIGVSPERGARLRDPCGGAR